MKKLFSFIIALSLILSLCTFSGFTADADKTNIASVSEDAEELRDFITKCTELLPCGEKTKKALFDKACKIYAPDNYSSLNSAKSKLKYKLVLDKSSSLNIICNNCSFGNTVIPVFEGEEALENMYCLCENCGYKFKYLEYCGDCRTENAMKPICCNSPLGYDIPLRFAPHADHCAA